MNKRTLETTRKKTLFNIDSYEPIENPLLYKENTNMTPLTSQNVYAHNLGSIPIHNWYTTVAGFSSDFVSKTIEENHLTKGDLILDPFSGTGTTALYAGQGGIRVYGVEANPFHHLVANVKLNFNVDRNEVKSALELVRMELKDSALREGNFVYEEVPTIAINDHLSSIKSEGIGPPEMPHLSKWMSPRVLEKVVRIKAVIENHIANSYSKETIDFVKVAFASILIPVSNMQLAGPKIAYRRKNKSRIVCVDAPVYKNFITKLTTMVSDLRHFNNSEWPKQIVKLGDSRRVGDSYQVKADLAITSPPYLNEVDYIENTRLELYFLDLIKSEKEMRSLKEHLIRANTKYLFSTNKDYPANLPDINSFNNILDYCKKIEIEWSKRQWGWDHPRLVAEYFTDMALHLKGMRKLLKDGAHYVVMVGDSAIDGVHVPTDVLLAEIGKDVGFSDASTTPFRWRSSSRHKTKLRESIIDFIA